MLKYRLLIVEDEEAQRNNLSAWLKKENYLIATAASGEEALELFKTHGFEMALVDFKLPGMDGMELLKKLKENFPDIQVIMITAYGDVDSAVKAMQEGAFHFIPKPLELPVLKEVLKRASEKHSILAENRFLKEQLAETFRDEQIVGESKVIKEVLSTITKVAKSSSTVLIRGESGTGKELIAKALHALSDRAGQKFVAISCAALPETLLESELFGYERGAFTGAVRTKPGRFELADGGTLFLDEIGDIPLETQVRLLRVIESYEFERLGGREPIKVDVRIIAATNQNLEKKIADRSFREDLYYRLNVISILLPPLRERKEDIALLVDYFIKRFNKKLNKNIIGVTPYAKDRLMAYDWPGNVRELENVIERAMVLCRGEALDSDDITVMGTEAATLPDRTFSEVTSLKEMEKKYILKALEQTEGSLGKAAELLGIHRNTLRLKIKEYGIEVKE